MESVGDEALTATKLPWRSAPPPLRQLLLAAAAASRSFLLSESLPLSPISYFFVAISALFSDAMSLDPDGISALSTFLSLVPEKTISPSMAAEAVGCLLTWRRGGGGVAGSVVKCLGFCCDDWAEVEFGFRKFLRFSIDKRPKIF